MAEIVHDSIGSQSQTFAHRIENSAVGLMRDDQVQIVNTQSGVAADTKNHRAELANGLGKDPTAVHAERSPTARAKAEHPAIFTPR